LYITSGVMSAEVYDIRTITVSVWCQLRFVTLTTAAEWHVHDVSVGANTNTSATGLRPDYRLQFVSTYTWL